MTEQQRPAEGEATRRKARSIELLKKQGVPFAVHLPAIEDSETALARTAQEIAGRAVCVLATIQVAFDRLNEEDVEGSVDFFGNLLEAFGVEDNLSENEQMVFSGELGRDAMEQLTWQYEAVWPLLWALGLVEAMGFPGDICDVDAAIQAVSAHESMDELLEAAELRPIGEILDQADLIYRYDWACVDARIHGKPAPAGLDPDVVVERHKGFNWLIGYGDDWDNLPCDT